MARVRERDVGAFEALYDTYHRLVHGIAVRMLHDVTAAEDLTQTIFLKLWSSPQAYESGNFGAWLARVTRNRALDALRSRTLRASGDVPADASLDAAPDEVVLSSIDGALVRAALRTLRDEERAPIEMGFFDGVTHDEIARRSGVPLGTVKTRIRSGLRKLRTALEASGAR